MRDCMPVLFDLIAAEPHPGVRAVLGHFFFVYIHPYMDGNGRLGRFLMNAMLATGGYVWTVVPVEQRKTYMEAPEAASAGHDITGFAAFIGQLIREQTHTSPLLLRAGPYSAKPQFALPAMPARCGGERAGLHDTIMSQLIPFATGTTMAKPTPTHAAA